MESAQTTGAESVAVRVHSRKSPRALDPQGLYQKALEQEVADPEVSEADLTDTNSTDTVFDHEEALSPEADPEVSPEANPEESPEESPEANIEANPEVKIEGSEQEVPDQQAISQSISGTQAVEAEIGDAQNDDNVVCETFDASPVDSSDEHYDQGSFANSVDAQTVHSAIIGADDRVSKKDLVSLLEGFVRIIKTDGEDATNNSGTNAGINTGTGINTNAGTQAATGTGIELSRPTQLAINEARVDDRTVEIDQLRGLVIEAQDTIIKLLTDRVEDRSRIATLEAQLCLIPDLQAQADRAMSVAVRTDEYRTELTKMKFELDRFRLFRVRIEAEQKKGSVFNRIQKWLFSRPMAKGDSQQRDSYQKMVDGSGTKNSAIS